MTLQPMTNDQPSQWACDVANEQQWLTNDQCVMTVLLLMASPANDPPYWPNVANDPVWPPVMTWPNIDGQCNVMTFCVLCYWPMWPLYCVNQWMYCVLTSIVNWPTLTMTYCVVLLCIIIDNDCYYYYYCITIMTLCNVLLWWPWHWHWWQWPLTQ